jgi:hypothetical protein
MREAAQLVKSRGVARGGPRKDLAGCELSVNRKPQVMEYYLAKAPNILAVWALLQIPAAVRSISRPARHGGSVRRPQVVTAA